MRSSAASPSICLASPQLTATTTKPQPLTLCPGALCDLLKETGLIEDFTLVRNSERVILFTDNAFPPGYGFEH